MRERSTQQTSSDAQSASTSESVSDDNSIPALARHAVETYILENSLYAPDPASLPSMLQRAAACFVSLKTFTGELRGCIGTIHPTRRTLAEEIIVNAVSAATQDPRFQPVSAKELSNLRYSVDVLDEPEPTLFEDLDPKVFGVIVQDEAGLRRGLLLPEIRGIESAEEQVQIAAHKAGISLQQPHRLFRFRVRRFVEGTHAE
jgi:AmmeMemoRadiSam system protein A